MPRVVPVYDVWLPHRGPHVYWHRGRSRTRHPHRTTRRKSPHHHCSRECTQELKAGDSVAVSGVCLTALDIKPGSFCADLAPETWARTSFSRMHEGALVNLELPMKADGRFGGHIVQGHVDGVGKLIALERIADSENWWLHIELPREVEKYTVYKGSVCIEGISLTVAKLEGRTLHRRHHSAHGGDDESQLAQARRSGQSRSRSDCEVCREDDEQRAGREYAHRGRVGAARILKTASGQWPVTVPSVVRTRPYDYARRRTSSSRSIVCSNSGLCADCVTPGESLSDRASTFLQCQLSFTDSRFEKYPRLPVLSCSGYAKGLPRGPFKFKEVESESALCCAWLISWMENKVKGSVRQFVTQKQ